MEKYTINTLNTDSEPQEYVSQLTARSKIVDILTKVETRQAFTDKLLDRELEQFNELDRGLVMEVVNGVIRWRNRLDWFLQQIYLGDYNNLMPDVKNSLRSAVYQLMYLDRIPPYAVLNEAVEVIKKKLNQKTANLVNAILRNFLRQYPKLKYVEKQLTVLDRLSVEYSHPKWLVERWMEFWGIDEVVPLCRKNNTPPRICIRLNTDMVEADTFVL